MVVGSWGIQDRQLKGTHVPSGVAAIGVARGVVAVWADMRIAVHGITSSRIRSDKGHAVNDVRPWLEIERAVIVGVKVIVEQASEARNQHVRSLITTLEVQLIGVIRYPNREGWLADQEEASGINGEAVQHDGFFDDAKA